MSVSRSTRLRTSRSRPRRRFRSARSAASRMSSTTQGQTVSVRTLKTGPSAGRQGRHSVRPFRRRTGRGGRRRSASRRRENRNRARSDGRYGDSGATAPRRPTGRATRPASPGPGTDGRRRRANPCPERLANCAALSHEPVKDIHRASRRNDAADDRDRPFRHCRVSPLASVLAAGSRLPDDTGGDILSRRQSGGHDLCGDGAVRDSIRPDAGSDADVESLVGRVIAHNTAF